MIVIDIKKPDTRLIDYYKTKIFEKSLSDMSIEDWIEIKKNCG